MFKRKFRLPRGIKFNNNSFISTPLVTIKTKENGLLFNRFSTIVSKKIDRRAVGRNRIRRLISSCMVELYSDLKQGYDMIIIVKIKAAGVGRQELFQDISSALKKVEFFEIRA